LIPFPLLLVVFGEKERRLRFDQRSAADLVRLTLGSAGVWLGFVLLYTANRCPVLQSSFVLDHCVKIFIFVLTVESMAQGMCGLERLAGFDTRPLVDCAVLSRTPAEFWRRWNTRVQPWLYLNVFVPCGGRRHMVRGVWAVFLASGVLHEISFAIATSQVTGYQLAFFLLQAPAVIYSPWLDRHLCTCGFWGVALARAVTIVWVGSTAVFFFDGISRIFPFVYAGPRLLGP
jgi:hypothetical protein